MGDLNLPSMGKVVTVCVLILALVVGGSFAAGWYSNRAYIKHYMDKIPDDPAQTNAFTACLKERWEQGWR